MTLTRTVAVAVSAALFSGCGGGAGGSGGIVPQHGAMRAATAGMAMVSFNITIPAPRGDRRKAHYVSPNTQSMTVSVNGGAPQAIGLAVGTDPRCTGEESLIVCTGLTVSAPPGEDTFVLDLYEQPLSSGQEPPNATLLSTYTTPLPIAIVEGANNTLGNFTLDGVVASIALTPQTLAAPADGHVHEFALTLTARDASGATIVAPGNYASPIDVTVAGDAHGAVSVTPSQISGPQPKSTTSIAVRYDASKPLTDATITASAAGATPGTAQLTPLVYALDSQAPIVVGGSTRTLTASMAGYDGAFTATASSTQVSVACSSATCKPATPGGSVTFIITGRSPGEATVVVSGGGTHATIPVQVIAPPIFAYTGAAQTFIVPAGVTHLRVDAFGAAGGNGQNGARGGLGGETLATLGVTAGARLQLFVGGAGGAARSCQGGGGGFNGGAGGGHRGEHHHSFCFPSTGGGGGGGASDVRTTAANATDRVIVAGGGGGGSGFGTHRGGNGGELTGEVGQGGAICSGGGGGTQTAGGKAGRCVPACFDRGASGGFGTGGAGGDGTGPLIPGGGGGAGGGGYYGGGGACGTTIVHAGGGGGGSSFAKAGSTDVTMRRGVRAGDGQIVLTW